MKILAMVVFAFSMMTTMNSSAQTIQDSEIEARARVVGNGLRCVVCQNEPIETSNAPLAEDMRKLVRVRIRAGDTNAQVMDHMRNRYGDFVLLKPPLQKNTYLLWFAPFGGLAVLLIWHVLRRRRTTKIDIDVLSAEEQAKFDALTDDLKETT